MTTPTLAAFAAALPPEGGTRSGSGRPVAAPPTPTLAAFAAALPTEEKR
jgi:hypothetical protein